MSFLTLFSASRAADSDSLLVPEMDLICLIIRSGDALEAGVSPVYQRHLSKPSSVCFQPTRCHRRLQSVSRCMLFVQVPPGYTYHCFPHGT